MYTTLRVTPPVVLHNCCSYTRKEVNRLPLPVSRNFGQPHNVITPLLHAVLNIYKVLKHSYPHNYPGSFFSVILDRKYSDPGSGINIQDPQHWLLYLQPEANVL
jgi:hypothetical protein